MPEAAQPLTAIPAGACATVTDIRLPDTSRSRVMELGLLPGTPVELVRFALLSDPVEIKVRGYNLTLRRQDADQIWVSLTGRR